MDQDDTSFDYDDEFSLDFNDPTLDSQLDSYSTQPLNIKSIIPSSSTSINIPLSRQPPPIQSIPKRNLLAPVQPSRHSQAILRPPQPPTKKNVSTNVYRGGFNKSNPIVPANPFQHKVIPIAKKVEILTEDEEELEEEEMPTIEMAKNGTYVKSIQSLPPPSSSAVNLNRKVVMGNRTDDVSNSWGRGESSSQMNGNAVASTSKLNVVVGKGVINSKVSQDANGINRNNLDTAVPSRLSDIEREELLRLRSEKASFEKSMSEFKQSATLTEKALLTKNGEVTIVRKNLMKTEALLQQQMEAAQTSKRVLEAKLEERERDFKREMEQVKMHTAFKNQEIETSASARRNSSQWTSTGRPRSNSLAPGSTYQNSMGPPPLPSIYAGSPSLGRTKGTGLGRISAPTSISKPIFPGFQNAFESPSISSQSQRNISRSETMPPPTYQNQQQQQSRKTLQTPVKGILKKPGSREKGKGRMLVDMTVEEEDEEERSRADTSMMVDESGYGDDIRMEDGDDLEEDVEMNEEERFENDWRGEILSSIFTHTTFIHYDSESVTAPSLLSQRPTASLSRLTATARSTAYSTFNNSTSTFHGNRSILPSTPPPPIDTSPIPTFHFLTNFRFPSNTSNSIVAEYEDICRDIFTLLGKRKVNDRGTHDGSFESRELKEREEMYSFIRGLGIGLEGMIRLLEQAGTIGPLIPLLSLISILNLLFPAFANYFLNDSKVFTTSNDSSTLPESNLLPLLARIIKRFGKPSITIRTVVEDTSNSLNSTSRGKAKERSRKQRGVVGKPNVALKSDNERVDVEPIKRDAMVRVIIEVLEGLAWRVSDGGEENFVQFLASPDVVATLLDINHPTGILTSTIDFLALLSTHTNLFRSIVGVPFTDGTELRIGSLDCALFNRIGTLSARKKNSHIQSYHFDMASISFVTSLLSKHDDAILLLTGTGSLLPELLQKLYQDVRTLWEYDGQDVTDSALASLKLVVKRLSSLVHFFYYLIGAPTSTFSIAEFLSNNKSHSGLPDRYNVAFGTLSYANLPDWAESIEEGSVLTTLSYLAQEIMEDVSPREAEEIESCFTIVSAEEGGDEEMMSGDEEERAFRQGLSQS